MQVPLNPDINIIPKAMRTVISKYSTAARKTNVGNKRTRSKHYVSLGGGETTGTALNLQDGVENYYSVADRHQRKVFTLLEGGLREWLT